MEGKTMQRIEQGRMSPLIPAALAALALAGPVSERVGAAPYEQDVTLHGAPAPSKVSGYLGTPFALAVDDDEQAIYAVVSQERRDNPCTLWIGTDSVNDSARATGAIKNLCGNTPSNRALRAQYRDDMRFGRRVFVTGIRVCTNNRETRVKGFQLRGKQIDHDGSLVALVYPDTGGGPSRLTGGEWDLSERIEHVNDPKNPADYRNNCREWHAWAECPEPNQVATGLTGYFEAGKEPRSLTGVRLQCRSVATFYVSATPK
jgi:hypothetical protein